MQKLNTIDADTLLSTPLPATRFIVDSLLPEGQLLIGHTEDEILEGMRSFIRGEVPDAYDFDVQTYNREVYQEFVRAIT